MMKTKLTLVSILVPGRRRIEVFMQLPYSEDGKVRLPSETLADLTSGLARGTTISVGG
jgi:hypothetical protein